ncbi:MAG: hypothetical protein J0L92_24745 [Deltaproteobacteria bacterium]|nr:hypothetical protein [Deltaproteobacteria bacterium]
MTMRTTTMLLLSLMAIGCAGPTTDTAPATEAHEAQTGERVVLSADAQTIYERALVRDASPPCEVLTAGITAPVSPLLEITERVTSPPSAGMRAAECLIEGHAIEIEIEPTLTSWVTHQATMGFGLLVLDRLDTIDPALGERLANAALAGEIADRARTRIARSERHHALAEGDVDQTSRP